MLSCVLRGGMYVNPQPHKSTRTSIQVLMILLLYDILWYSLAEKFCSYLNIHLHHCVGIDAGRYWNKQHNTDVLQWLWIIVSIWCKCPGPALHDLPWARAQPVTAPALSDPWPHLHNRSTWWNQVCFRCGSYWKGTGASPLRKHSDREELRTHPWGHSSLLPCDTGRDGDFQMRHTCAKRSENIYYTEMYTSYY